MPAAPTATRQAIRNRLTLSMVLFVLLCALSIGLTVAIVAGTISTISERTRTTLALVDTATDLRLAITAERALAMDYGLSRSPRTLDAFGDAQEAEQQAYVEFSRLAPDDAELTDALARVRILFGSWRENFAEPYLGDVTNDTAVSGGVAVVQSESAFRPVVGAIDDLTAVINERQATAETVLSGAL